MTTRVVTRRPESRIDFLSPLSVIPGFGPRRVEAMKAGGYFTLGDLLANFPLRYVDRSRVVPIGDLPSHQGNQATVAGEIGATRVERGRRPRLRIQVKDATGTMDALWFHGVPYLRKSMRTGMRLVLTGTVGYYRGPQMIHPISETLRKDRDAPDVPFMPRYCLTNAMREAGITQNVLLKGVRWVLDHLRNYPRTIPAAVEKEKGFPPLSQCYRELHLPSDLSQLERYRSRIRYEELYHLAIQLQWSRRKFALPGRSMKPGELYERFREGLPFALTNDQREAIDRLHEDSAGDRRMHRLLQGDVGSGKTLVAFCACLPALNEGRQVVWMTPTEVLADQTARVVGQWLDRLGLSWGTLTGGMAAVDRQKTLTGLARGTTRVVVGTHALLAQSVRCAALSMIVIDEQHKFGIRQRLLLQEKEPTSDLLLMSATPIPHTLAGSLYGDLDVVTLRSRPFGRPAVSTHLVPEAKQDDMQDFLMDQVRTHRRQIFYVTPRVDAEESEDGWSKSSARKTFDRLRASTPAGIRLGLLHGRLGAAEKRSVLARFASGDIDLLVATTIVEVGVDVGGAGILVVEDAECFGLSQLHQLRGRIGRDGRRGYCFLLTNSGPESEARKRLQFFRGEHDGFAVAEADLRLRGPGEVLGVRQTGWDDLKLADMVRDASLFRQIRQTIEALAADSPAKLHH